MSLPTAVFLDTSILDGQQYNFASTAFSSFLPVARERNFVVLLPDPTKREVLRHIEERSQGAVRALEDARRRAPFLNKWKHFPKLPDNKWLTNFEVRTVAIEEWQSFLNQFSVKELNYDAVVLSTVMDWYEKQRPPFGSGKKRKEFPDAFAIAALAAYAGATKTYIAVVAEDPDFKGACEHFPYLLYFPNLPALTELLLADEKTIEGVRELVLQNQPMIEEAAQSEGESLSLYVPSEFEILDGGVTYVSLDDIRVVALGNRECTVALEGQIGYEVKLKRDDYSYRYEDDYDHRRGKTVEGDNPLSGTAKLQMSSDRNSIEKVTYIELDNAEIEVSAPVIW